MARADRSAKSAVSALTDSDQDLTKLSADYQAAKVAFLAANSALTARIVNRTPATAAQICALRSATSILNAAGRVLSAAERAAG